MINAWLWRRLDMLCWQCKQAFHFPVTISLKWKLWRQGGLSFRLRSQTHLTPPAQLIRLLIGPSCLIYSEKSHWIQITSVLQTSTIYTVSALQLYQMSKNHATPNVYSQFVRLNLINSFVTFDLKTSFTHFLHSPQCSTSFLKPWSRS